MDMDVNYILANPKGRCTGKFIKKNFPDDYLLIMQMCGERFSEKLYNYIHHSPKHICPVCGRSTPFRNIIYGYSEYCSVKCSYSGESRISKARETCIKKYGVSNPSQVDSIKEKKKQTIEDHYGGFGFASKHISDKSYKTIEQKYGVSNPSQADSIKEKKKQTTLKHYGVDSILKLPGVRRAAKEAIIKKYGVDSVFKLEDYQRCTHENLKSKMIEVHEDLIGYDCDGNWIIKCNHPECSKCSEKCFHIKQVMYHDRLRNGSELCTKLLEPGQSNQGTTIELFVRSILDEHHITYETNVRNIIPPKELDIYIPEHKIAIECNGIYWHSDKDNKYHRNKWGECQAKGIQLITIWEDWVHRVPDIVRSLILSKLGIYKERIGARRCDVREINGLTANKFLNHNHIQGGTRASVHLGLYYNDSLYGVMTFSHKSKLSGSKNINSSEWELSRFCTKCNTQIVGGAEKLLKYFIRHYHPLVISSFSSNDISNGNLYKKLGFTSDLKLNESYWYVDSKTYNRYHRSSFTKNNIIKKGLAPNKDNWTESEAMSSTQYLKIYDTGTIKWTMKLC